MMPLRVMLAEEHVFTLLGMQHCMDAYPTIEICAVARSGVEAIAQARLHRPDVVLLDFTMPDATGLEIFFEITRWSHATRCIIVTGNGNPEVLAKIVSAGVGGLFTKACPIAAVVDGIHRIAQGEQVVSALAGKLLAQAVTGGNGQLTARELQILQGIARGMTNAAMASTLGISPKTVDSHRTSLMRKLDANSAPALVLAAIRRGHIAP